MASEQDAERDERWLSTAAAAEHLGVKPATLYAYVSRGLIDSRPASRGRGSLFHVDDVRRLARKGRGHGEAAGRELVVRSAITEIADGRLRYRGHDVTELAGEHSFDDVAELLWTGRLPVGSAEPWTPSAPAVATGARAQQALPPGTSSLDRLRLITVTASAADPLRGDLRPDAVLRCGRALIATLVHGLPALGDVGIAPDAGRLAGSLWPRLSARPASPGLVHVLDAALVLLADHELAASTLAARVAASARCDPYAVVECGLAAVGGSLHGAAAGAVEALLSGGDPASALQRVARRLREHGSVPGFGHFAYPDGDPRAAALLQILRATDESSGGLQAAETVLDAAADRGLPPPNIDFALAALTTSVGMQVGAAETIFGLARCAGWVAHALEQYESGELIRPRAIYIGPPGQPGGQA